MSSQENNSNNTNMAKLYIQNEIYQDSYNTDLNEELDLLGSGIGGDNSSKNNIVVNRESSNKNQNSKEFSFKNVNREESSRKQVKKEGGGTTSSYEGSSNSGFSKNKKNKQ